MFGQTVYSGFKRLFGFGLGPLLGALSPLIVMPVVARVGTVAEWSVIGVGQAVGGFGAIVVALGISTTGPTDLANLHTQESRLGYYSDCFWMRAIAFIVVGIVLPLVTLPLVPSGHFVLAALSCWSMMITGMNIGWYGVGIGSPRVAVMFATVPKVVFTLISILPLILLRSVMWYPLLLFLGTLSGIMLFHVAGFRRLFPPASTPSRMWAVFRSSVGAGVIEATSAVPSMGVVPFSQYSLPVLDTARISSGDKVFRYGSYSIDVLGDTFQAWVLNGVEESRRVRFAISLATHSALGVSGFVIFAGFGTTISRWLFGTVVSAQPSVMLAYGFAFLFRSLSRPILRTWIAPHALMGTLSRWNSVVSFCIVVCMVFSARFALGGESAMPILYAASEAFFLLLSVVVSVWNAGR